MSSTNLVYIVGMGHSGSTLVDLILGSHPSAFSVGEIDFWGKWLAENKICTCGKEINQCEFWNGVLDNLKIKMPNLSPEVFPTTIWWNQTTPLQRLRYLISIACIEWLPSRVTFYGSNILAPEMTQRVNNIFQLYDSIRTTSKKRVIIDSSKSYRRMVALHAFCPDSLKILWVVKDGRGWITSRMRQTGESALVASQKWRDGHQKILKILRRFPKSTYKLVNYEAVCRDTENTIEDVLNFIGLSYTSSVLEFRQIVHHNINGNPMRMQGGGIREDLRWRESLSKEDLVTFDRVAGELNRQLLGKWYLD